MPQSFIYQIDANGSYYHISEEKEKKIEFFEFLKAFL